MDIIKSDVFFLITAIAIIVLTVGMSVVIYHVVRILKVVEGVATMLSRETIAGIGAWIVEHSFVGRWLERIAAYEPHVSTEARPKRSRKPRTKKAQTDENEA